MFENNHEVPSPVEFDNSSLPRQFYSNQILNDETIKEPSSEEVVTNTVEAEVNGNWSMESVPNDFILFYLLFAIIFVKRYYKHIDSMQMLATVFLVIETLNRYACQ